MHLKKKRHNMLVLMLDPQFKSMRLVVNYLDCEPASALVKEYDVHLKNLCWCNVTRWWSLLCTRWKFKCRTIKVTTDDLLQTSKTSAEGIFSSSGIGAWWISPPPYWCEHLQMHIALVEHPWVEVLSSGNANSTNLWDSNKPNWDRADFLHCWNPQYTLKVSFAN